MACGVPVVISNRGSLPEVAGDAATPVEPTDVIGLAREMELLLAPDQARAASVRGLKRAAFFTWERCAAAAVAAYRQARNARASAAA
jgi:alpha-1,3-rhamnosyl/mannosyltransferase